MILNKWQIYEGIYSSEESTLWKVLGENGVDVSVSLIRELSFVSDGIKGILMLGSNKIEISSLKNTNITGLNFVKISSNTGIKDTYLLFSWHWNVLFLLKEFSELLSSVQKLLCGGIKI